MKKIRWLLFTCGIVLFLAAFLRGEMKEATIAFALGLVGGCAIDLLGIGALRLWRYPRQPFLGLRYFGIVVPCWGVFSLTINLLWNWLEAYGASTPLILVAMTIVLFVFYEFTNLKTQSWKYSPRLWVVAIGWFPLVLGFRYFFIVLS